MSQPFQSYTVWPSPAEPQPSARPVAADPGAVALPCEPMCGEPKLERRDTIAFKAPRADENQRVGVRTNKVPTSPKAPVESAHFQSPWHPEMPNEFRNQIVTGDARKLARSIPAASVDLVFTDPVYERLDDYYWLSKEAVRVLRPAGGFLCFCAIGLLEDTMATLRHAGTPVKWTCAIYKPGASQRVFQDVFNHWVALLWCLGRPRKTIADTQVSQLVHLGGPHKWKKGIHAITRHLDGFASPGDVVWDPFCGGGTVEVACKALGINYVASEIDPETATLARERVRLTPEPLFTMDAPEPLALDLFAAAPHAPETATPGGPTDGE